MSRAGNCDALIPNSLDIFAGINDACEVLFHVSRLMIVGGKVLKVISDIRYFWKEHCLQYLSLSAKLTPYSLFA